MINIPKKPSEAARAEEVAKTLARIESKTKIELLPSSLIQRIKSFEAPSSSADQARLLDSSGEKCRRATATSSSELCRHHPEHRCIALFVLILVVLCSVAFSEFSIERVVLQCAGRPC
eukprot:1272103-Lingulodinium_polyedra.AAC.1